MSVAESSSANPPSSAIQAEAAAWLARLHGPNRTPNVDKGFRRWLNLSPEHGRAFEIATDTWERLALVRRRPLERVADWERGGVRLSLGRAALAAAAVVTLTVAVTAYYYSSDDAIATKVGEQRIVTLEDGTRVALNTATRVRVDFDKSARRIELQSGEALFQVAPQSTSWPFIVTAGGQQIRALGTAFVVRRDDTGLAVTLVDGKVSVAPVVGSQPAPGANAQVLTPGQRLTFHGSHAPNLDTPALDKITAWQRGQVAFDNAPLIEAVAEMNRYSRDQLVVASPQAAALRISGVFRTSESAEFARAIAQTYALQVTVQSRKITLTGAPQLPVAGARAAPTR